jgi:uncharacterized protein Usg
LSPERRQGKLCSLKTAFKEMLRMASDSQFSRQLEGYRLATAEILYHLPDHPKLLQTFIWQDYDLAPQYPVLNRFLDFWTRELDGALHSVKVAGRKIVSAAEIKAGTLFRLN